VYFTDAYDSQKLVYQWESENSVNLVKGMALSQFDLISYPHRNLTFNGRYGKFPADFFLQ
jgi:gamma-aminobutyric acid receptor subunit alpha